MAKHHVSTVINGEPVEFLCEPQQTLLDVLRDELNLTGSKEGCSSGDCGACTVICEASAKALVGHSLDEPTLAALDAAAGRACNPITDKRGTIEYRIKVAGVLARRAAAIAFERAAKR